MVCRTHEYVTFTSMNCGVLMKICSILLDVRMYLFTCAIWSSLQNRYNQAKLSMQDRTEKVCCVVWTVFVLCVIVFYLRTYVT